MSAGSLFTLKEINHENFPANSALFFFASWSLITFGIDIFGVMDLIGSILIMNAAQTALIIINKNPDIIKQIINTGTAVVKQNVFKFSIK